MAGPLAVVIALLGAGEAAAQDARLSKVGTRYQFNALVPKANRVSLDFAAANFTFRDDNSTIEVSAADCTGAGTTVPAGTTISCPAAGIATLQFFFGQGDDRLGVLNPDMTTTIGAVGEAGNDELQGARGNDVLGGGPGDDRIAASFGNDLLDPVNQIANNADGNDTLFGGPNADLLTGGPGDDSLTPGPGDDGTVNGGEGSDTVSYDDGRVNGVSVSLEAGGNTDGGVEDEPNPALRENLVDVENVTGSQLGDVLVGSPVNNRLLGQAGDDTLEGRDGSDHLDGGDGFDITSYAGRAAGVEVNLATPDLDDGSAADGAKDRNLNIEGAIGTEANDVLRGTDGGSALSGGGGNDQLFGGAAGDALDGGEGADGLDGAGGADTYTGGGGDDSINAADGVAESVNCGAGGADFAATDATDTRLECELPAPIIPPPPPPPPKPLRTMAVTVTFNFFPKKPKKTTRFELFKVKSVPRGSKVVARCLTKKGKRCKGKLGKRFTRNNARGDFRVKRFDRKYRFGRRLEIVITNPAFRTQIKTVKIRRNKTPDTITRCQVPGSPRRTSCTN